MLFWLLDWIVQLNPVCVTIYVLLALKQWIRGKFLCQIYSSALHCFLYSPRFIHYNALRDTVLTTSKWKIVIWSNINSILQGSWGSRSETMAVHMAVNKSTWDLDMHTCWMCFYSPIDVLEIVPRCLWLRNTAWEIIKLYGMAGWFDKWWSPTTLLRKVIYTFPGQYHVFLSCAEKCCLETEILWWNEVGEFPQV